MYGTVRKVIKLIPAYNKILKDNPKARYEQLTTSQKAAIDACVKAATEFKERREGYLVSG